MKTLKIKDIEWRVIATQDDIPVRGNALQSGSAAIDEQCEGEINRRLDNGDVWAWASVEVRGYWNGIEASDYLGCCSYEDEADFRKNSGYFEDMQQTILDEIQEKAEAIAQDICEGACS